MKWERPTGSVQTSKCGCYTIQHATEHYWVAYHQAANGAEKLGERDSESQARTLCDNHETQLSAARKAG